jgi:hypothetical protein
LQVIEREDEGLEVTEEDEGEQMELNKELREKLIIAKEKTRN